MYRTKTLCVPLLFVLLAGAGLCLPAQAVTIGGFAAMGASETQGNSFNGSWVPYLVQDRGLNFGPSNGYNRAVGGATTTSLLSGNQHHQVHDIVDDGNADVAFLFIGGNDFGAGNPIPVVGQLALGLLNADTWSDGMVGRMMTATDRVLEADPLGMIIAGVPDMTLVPAAQTYLPSATPQMIQNVVDAIDLLNSKLKAEVLARELVFLDTAQAMRDMNAIPLVVGGVTINTVTASSNPRHFFQDGLHPAVVGNGVFANLMITAINLGFDQSIAPISDQTMLQRAGLIGEYTGETSNLPYASYVYVVPEPASIALWTVGGAALVLTALRQRQRKLRKAA